MPARALSAGAVLLAGGRSARAGALKGLFVRGGVPWLEAQVRALGERANCGSEGPGVVVVLGHRFDEYGAALPGLADALAHGGEWARVRARPVLNTAPERGPFSSLQCGLRALRGRESVYVLPLDVPCAAVEVFAGLRAALVDSVLASVPVCDGRGGHPVLLRRALVERLLSLDPGAPEARLDVQLRALDAYELARVAVEDPRVCANLNTPEDWDAFAG